MDGWFGTNLRAARERRGLSQAALAERMKGRGFAFHTMTVNRIEQGERPPRLVEAVALAEIVNSDLSRLLRVPDQEKALADLEEFTARLRDSLNGFASSTVMLYRDHRPAVRKMIAAAEHAGLEESEISEARRLLRREPLDEVKEILERIRQEHPEWLAEPSDEATDGLDR